MRDKRPVDELSIEELERVLAIRKREERQHQMARLKREGRVMTPPPGVPRETPRAETPPHAPEPPAADPAPPPVPEGAPRFAPPPAAPSAHPVRLETGVRFEDEDLDSADYAPPAAQDDGRIWRRFTNTALLLVEVAAVLGLVLLGYNLLQAIGNLERETADAAALANQQRMAGIPTIAPTPVVRLAQVVLPGGHTPPGSPGGVQFNFAEIPGHLLARVQDEILQPVLFRPPPTDETALRVVIPQISVDWTIVQGVDWEALKAGVGQVVNGVDPGDPTGNVVLAGHNDVYGEAFRELDQLQPGDQFQIITATRAYTYVVTGWDIYLPSDVHVMDNRVGATATLISCYPYRVSDKRIVVFADRVDS